MVLDKLAKQRYFKDKPEDDDVEMVYPQKYHKKWPNLNDEDTLFEGGKG